MYLCLIEKRRETVCKLYLFFFNEETSWPVKNYMDERQTERGLAMAMSEGKTDGSTDFGEDVFVVWSVKPLSHAF